MELESIKSQRNGRYKDISTFYVGRSKFVLVACEAADVLLQVYWPNKAEQILEGKRPPFSCISWLVINKKSIEYYITQEYYSRPDDNEMTSLEFQNYFLKAMIEFSSILTTMTEENLRQHDRLGFKICSLITVIKFLLRQDEQYAKNFIQINQEGFILVSFYDFKTKTFKKHQYSLSIPQIFARYKTSQLERMNQEAQFKKYVFQRELNKIIYETFINVLDEIGEDGVDPQKCFMAAHLPEYKLTSLRIHIDQSFQAHKIEELIYRLKFFCEKELEGKQSHYLLSIGYHNHFYGICQIDTQSIKLQDPRWPADKLKKVDFEKLQNIIIDKFGSYQYYHTSNDVNLVTDFSIHILGFIKNGEKEYNILHRLDNLDLNEKETIFESTICEISRKILYQQWRQYDFEGYSIIFGGQ